MKYKRRMHVEVMFPDEGYEGSFYKGKIISFSPTQGYFVIFETLKDETETEAHKQYVKEENIRPLPPCDLKVRRSFKVGEVVDADTRGGWWKGKIEKKVSGLYLVKFQPYNDELYLEPSCIRVHQHYNNKYGFWSYKKK